MTLQDQYTLIKEGKGNKEIFLKQAKSLFPQYITNASTFQETTSILKQRGIISEAAGGVVTTGTTPDWISIFKENMGSIQEGDIKAALDFYNKNQSMGAKAVAEKFGVEEADLIKALGQTPGGLFESNEAKAVEKKTTKYVKDAETRNYNYEDEKNVNNASFNQYLLGLSVEIDNPKNVDKTVDELKAIVTKNLTKDNQYYLKNGQFGIEGLGYTDKLPGYSPSKEVKGKYKASGMEPVKLKESIPGRSPQIGSNAWEYQFNTWKEKLYSIIMNDAGLDKDEIAVDELELQKYFNANMSPEQVYNDVWLKDAGNFRSTGLFEIEGLGEESRDALVSILFKYIDDPEEAEDQANAFEMTGKFSDDRLSSIENDEDFIEWLKGEETPYEDSKYNGYVNKDMGGNPDIYESKLRKLISTLIKEAIDIKSIEDTGKKASDNAKAKLIDKEIAKRKKKLKALTTLKELEEDSVNPKKIKELNDDIKKLEKLKSKLGESKKSSKPEDTQVLDEDTIDEATLATNTQTSTQLTAAYKKKQTALQKLAAAEAEVGKADAEIQNIEKK